MKILRNFSVLYLCASLSHCAYGPTREAKVATAIQTLMANLIEESFGGSTGDISCAESGTFSAADPIFGTIDPLNPGGTTLTTAITFDQCTIKVCGESFILNGSGTSIILDFDDFAGGGEGTNTASIQIAVSGQTFGDGFLTGVLSFGYTMSATVANQTLQSIIIQDSTPANPLIYNGKTFNGSELNELADGC